MKKLFLIDAYALIFKYYYAFMGRPMRNRAGMNTSIVFGFTKFLRDIQKREKPDLLGVAFDPAGGSFRREIFEPYKANRPTTPEDILLSVPYVKRIVEAMCIPILEVPHFEADDVIGTLAFKGAEAGYDVFMVTPDKDYGQLVGEHRKIYKQKGDGVEIVDIAAIKEKYGIDRPVLVRDILALWGDASDNIPGVPGIGEKGASRLVREWGEVENIIAAADKIGGKTGSSILANEEQLRLAKTLTTIRLDVPIEFDERALTVSRPNVEALRALYMELDFRAFAADLTSIAPAEPTTQPRSEALPPKVSTPPTKTTAKRTNMEGQGSLFEMFGGVEPTPAVTQPSVVQTVKPSDEESTEGEMQPSTFATAPTTPHTYTIVGSEEALREVVAKVGEYDEFCFDVETTGFDIFSDRIVGLSLAVEPHHAWYIPFGRENRSAVEESYGAILRPLFENEKCAKIGQNMKFDILFLRGIGVEVRGMKWDTMLLHYILDAEARHGMNALSERYLGYTPIEIETLIGRGTKQLSMDRVPLDTIAEYAGEDADITLQLCTILRGEVERLGLMRLYKEIEEPLIDVLADMEWTGVTIDTAALNRYSTTLSEELLRLEAEIRRVADSPTLNVNSSRQLGEVLFTQLRIDSKPKMTKTKQFCTDEEYLQSLSSAHPVVDLILQYRGVKKLLSTYVDALPQLVNPITGCVHTSYNQAVTATGRLSSANPNLQNIPIREAQGRPIRAAFVPSDERHCLVAADYSQVELRIMAHLSGDSSLREAFRHGEDIHAATAAKIFGKPIAEVTSEERRRAKTANFGIIYGISSFGLAQRLSIPRGEAKALIEGYFASYPEVHNYMEKVKQLAREQGYVTTMFARRRYLADIESRNANVRAFAERNAINAPIQGSAADIMKLAMVAVWRRLRREGLRSRIILQVHDEIVLNTLLTERERVEQILREEMEGAAAMSVPLVVDIGVGTNWLEAH